MKDNSKSTKGKLSLYLRICISLTLLAILIKKANLADLIATMLSINLLYIGIAMLIVIVDRLIVIYRWKVLLHAKGFVISFVKSAWFFFVGEFFGIFLPTSIGSDASRAINFGRYTSNHTEAASSIFIDRFTGMVALLILAFCSIFLSRSLITNSKIITAAITTAIAFIIIITLLYNERLFKKTLHLLKSEKMDNFKKRLYQLHTSLNLYIRNKKLIFNVLLLSFSVHTLRVFTVYFIGLSLNIHLQLYYYFMVIPLILFVAALPISLEGIGVREYAFIYFFAKFGISNHQAITTSLVFCGLGIFSALIGAIIYLLHGLPRKHESEK